MTRLSSRSVRRADIAANATRGSRRGRRGRRCGADAEREARGTVRRARHGGAVAPRSWRDGARRAATCARRVDGRRPAAPAAPRSRALAYPALVGRPRGRATACCSTPPPSRAASAPAATRSSSRCRTGCPADPPPGPGPPGQGAATRRCRRWCSGVDEQESPHHELLRDADDLAGMPVVVADLHSALPAVLAGCAQRRPDAAGRLRHDGRRRAAGLVLPHASAGCARPAGWPAASRSGQAFGGDLEAVTLHTGAARGAARARRRRRRRRAGPRQPRHRHPLGVLRGGGRRGGQRGRRARRPPGRRPAGLRGRPAGAAPRRLAPQPHRLRPGGARAGGRRRPRCLRRRPAEPRRAGAARRPRWARRPGATAWSRSTSTGWPRRSPTSPGPAVDDGPRPGRRPRRVPRRGGRRPARAALLAPPRRRRSSVGPLAGRPVG